MRGVRLALFFAVVLAALVVLHACGLPADAPPWEEAGVGPPERWGHVAVFDERRDRMLIFGGEQARGQLDDVWALDLGTLQWSEVATSGAPGPRSDMMSVLDVARDRWLMVGGRVGLASSIDEVWSLDLATNQWSELPAAPVARHDIASATDGSRAWFFGGAGDLFQSLDDLWELDLATDEWTLLPAGEPHPIARTSYGIAYRDGFVYLHGGHDVARVFRDTWRYDLANARWEQLEVSGAPAANAHFAQAVDEACGALYLTGGDNLDNFVVGTTDALVLGDRPRFTRLRASALPYPRDHASLALDGSHRLILFGGGSLGDGLDTFEDTWTYAIEGCP